MISIQLAERRDLSTVRNLAHAIWPLAYHAIISTEQITYMLNLIYSDAALDEQFSKGHQFLIASENGEAVGFASFSLKSPAEPGVFRLHKLYVRTEIHSKGIGSTLLNEVIAFSKKEGADVLELNVNKQNAAVNFYKKKGFDLAFEEIIDIGSGYVMDDFVMQKKLSA